MFSLLNEASSEEAVAILLVPLDSWLARKYGITDGITRLCSVEFSGLSVLASVYCLAQLLGTDVRVVYHLLKWADFNVIDDEAANQFDGSFVVLPSGSLTDLANAVGLDETKLVLSVEKGLKRYPFMFLDESLAKAFAKPITVAPLLAACFALKDRSYKAKFAAVIENATIAVKFPLFAQFNAIFAYYYSLLVALDEVVQKIFANQPVEYISPRTLSAINLSCMMHAAVRTVIDSLQCDLLRFIYSCDYNFQWWVNRWRWSMRRAKSNISEF